MRLGDLDALRQDWLENGENEYVYDTNAVLDSIDNAPTIDPEDLRPKGRWEDNRCSNCGEEAVCSSIDEPIYDYDWEENLQFSHTETYIEYHLTNYCPNCGAKMEDKPCE